MREWNILATSLEGRRPALQTALRRLGTFWGAGFKNVLVGRVADQPAFLEAVRERLSADMLLEGALTKVVPVDHVAVFEHTRLAETAVEILAPYVDRIAGKTFHVRVERRGLKGVVHTPTVERVVGEALLAAAAQHGPPPKVTFRDPDLVVAIETTGDTVGIALLARELRSRFPFVRVS